MLKPILQKVSALPSDRDLRAMRVVVEHELRGNREQTEPLAASLVLEGKSARVDGIEVGTHLVIQDAPASFRRNAKRRLEAICHFAARHRLKYDSWWITGNRYSDYVSQ